MNNEEMLEKIEEVIASDVRPKLLSHEGDVEIISYEDGICRVRLLGRCSGCPSAFVTTEEIIQNEIQKALPQVAQVVLVQETSDDLLDFARKLLKH